jgi:exodeoxyribonuclease VII large subunit
LMNARLAKSHARLDPLRAQLLQLSPLRVLERGYAIVQTDSGEIVKNSRTVPVDATIRVRLAEGALRARVTANE